MFVAVFVGVLVAVREGVTVFVGVNVGVLDGVLVGVRVVVAVLDAVNVAVGVFVLVDVAVAVLEGVMVAVAVLVGVRVAVAVLDAVNVAVGVFVFVGVLVGRGITVMRNVSAGEVSIPPLVVPPSSCKVNVTVAVPEAPVWGVNVSVPFAETAGWTANRALLSLLALKCTVCPDSVEAGPALIVVAQFACVYVPEFSCTLISDPMVKLGTRLGGVD